MEKKLYKVPVTWTMSGTYYIRASSPEAAKEAAYQAPLPNGEYVDDSFSIDEDADGVQEEKYYKPKNVIEADEDDDDICKDCDSPKRIVMVSDAVGNGLHKETVCDCDTSA